MRLIGQAGRLFNSPRHDDGFKPKEWLASHVAVGIQQGWTAQEVLELLFGDETLAQAVAESIQEEPMAVTKRSRDSRKHKPAFTDIA